MTVSIYFNHVDYTQTQDLIQDLVTESIQQRGIDTVYIKRDDYTPDFLFGEPHAITDFTDHITIEMLVKSYNGGGYNDILMEKFGLQLDDTLNLQVSIDRFEEEAAVIELTRPEIGDLIYIDFLNSTFEIKKCYFSDEDTLYQRGVNYFHNLELVLFEPSLGADEFTTGISDIDDNYDIDINPGDESDDIDNEDSISGIINDFDDEKFTF